VVLEQGLLVAHDLDVLGQILGNRFGRNIRINPNLVKFRFVILT
jgi:hypothetical protein